MKRNVLLTDAAIAAVLAIVVIVVSPGLAVVAILAIAAILVCGVSFLAGRARHRRSIRRNRAGGIRLQPTDPGPAARARRRRR